MPYTRPSMNLPDVHSTHTHNNLNRTLAGYRVPLSRNTKPEQQCRRSRWITPDSSGGSSGSSGGALSALPGASSSKVQAIDVLLRSSPMLCSVGDVFLYTPGCFPGNCTRVCQFCDFRKTLIPVPDNSAMCARRSFRYQIGLQAL